MTVEHDEVACLISDYRNADEYAKRLRKEADAAEAVAIERFQKLAGHQNA